MKHALLLLSILLLPLVLAQSGNITLLTVADTKDGGLMGGTAELYLDIKPGTGTIFIDSYPLTKLDTQISTRFANQVACDIIQEDCTAYDFFYTIRANSPIVGGPSAGAATALLTIAVLKHLELNRSMVMTGTINSGGLVGPVAGIPEKVAAAHASGFSEVLIPRWSADCNCTGIRNISTLQEAVHIATGYVFPEPEPLHVPQTYTKVMRAIAGQLCARASDLGNISSSMLLSHYLGQTLFKMSDAQELYLKGLHAWEESKYYSAASYCFGANQKAREEEYAQLPAGTLEDIRNNLTATVQAFTMNISTASIHTISDLQAYIIVKERLLETEDYLEAKQRFPLKDAARLARAQERFFSAQQWSAFFTTGKTSYELNEPYLRQACIKKLAEAEERMQYAAFYFPSFQQNTLDEARRQYAKNDYALCIFQASKTKAETELLITNLFMNQNDTRTLLQETLSLADNVIAREQATSTFPVLGYSYAEYAKSLQYDDPWSALLYANYALELSNLDSYFPKQPSQHFNKDTFLVFVEGMLVGALLVCIVLLLLRKNPERFPPKREPSREKR
ncbi:MAG: S16 family serine protease [archaeon]